MRQTLERPARFAVRLGARGMVVAGAYVLAAAAMLITVILVRDAVTPAALRGFLAFVFVATLAAGLEPGTAKADALDDGGRAGVATILGLSALKALVAAPIIALVWRFADPDAGWTVLAWSPGVCVAGFCVTDLRVLHDLRGRYAMAIGLKQGALAGGIVLAGGLLTAGAGLGLAVGFSTLGRLAIAGAAGLAEHARRGGRWSWADARRRLVDPRWLDLAAVSVIAAISGSADRVFGLRLLDPAAYGGYFLVFEILSKFWLIPYVLAPIVFARQASGQETGAFLRGAWGFTAVAGAAFLAALAGLLALAPNLAGRLLDAAFGPSILLFAAGVVVGSFVQLRIAALQGEGASRRAAVVSAFSAAFSVALFYVAARRWGAPGLLSAWLVKSLVELSVAMLPGSRHSADGKTRLEG